MPDGRLLLQVKDAPFDRPVLSRFTSDGTLKMLAYLVVLLDPEPARFIGIEEPETLETVLHLLLPKMIGDLSYAIHPYQCKQDLLAKLPNRLRGYRQ